MAQKQKTPQVVDDQLFEGETLYWWGQPMPSYTLRRINWMSIIMPIFIICFAIAFIFFTQNMLADMQSPSLFGRSRSGDLFDTLFPIFFLLIPLFMIGSAGWAIIQPIREWYATTKTYYALTDKRAIIIVQTSSTDVKSYYDEQMKQLQVKQYGNGVGDIIFASKTQTRTYQQGRRNGFGVTFDDNGTHFNAGRRQRTVSYDVPEGFFAVPDARVVEDFIAQIFFDDDKKK